MTEKYDVLFTPAGELRRLHIYLPDNYNESEERYPVMYFFDGHNLYYDKDATYGKSWGLKEFMDNWGKDMIIVGVECSMTNRLVEYCPYHFTKGFLGEIDGTGVATLDWLIGELKPIIDERYRTIPFRECTAIGGASMGGLMSLYAVLAHNDVFSRAACLSPSVWTCPRPMRRLIAKADVEDDTVIYMDYGSREFANHEGMRALFADMSARLMRRGLHLTSRIVPGGEHCEASWEEQIPFFINTLLYHKS